MQYVPKTEKDMAGVTAYQNEGSNYVFGLTKKGKETYLVLQKNSKPNSGGETISEIIASEPVNLDGSIDLKISAEGNEYQFSYAINNSDFKTVGGTVSGDILSTDVAGGFTGAMLGLYATADNDIVLE
jgi:alpha-N-arabinofuranosidase